MSELSPAPAHHAPTRRLAGWSPAGMHDWPGRVAATISLSGCSLSCPYCDAAVTPSAAPVADWDVIVADIEERRSWLDGVVVSGGEPTEDPDLPSLLAAITELGMPVRLDTNGTDPDVLRHLLAEQLVDFVALDIKAVPARYDTVSPSRRVAANVAECAEMLIRSGIAHEFRTVVYPECVELDDLPRIARSIRGGRLYSLVQYEPMGSAARDDRGVCPYEDEDVRAAAAACSIYLPTIVRGTREAGADRL